MAIEAKMNFIEDLQRRLAAEVTAADLQKILAGVSDVLAGYDMQEVYRDGTAEDDLLEQYLMAMRVGGLSQKTIDRYEYVIRRMTKTMGVPCGRITIYHLRTYLAKEQERGIMDSTLDGMRQIFSAFYNWLQRESLIERNPTANLSPIRRAKKRKETYSDVEIEKLNQACGHVRDRAISAFLGSTGCRVSEMTELNRENVDLERLEAIVHGKGNKERIVYMSQVTGMLIQQYFDERKDNCPALFAGRGGKRLQPDGVRCMLKRIAKAAGVAHVHPHKFRRTLATALERHGMQIQKIAAILGHEKLDTTMKYVVMNNDDVKNDYRRLA